MGSLVLDYVLRMKVSANLNWFFLETLPIPETTPAFEVATAQVVRRLNVLGADFGEPVDHPLVDPAARLAARLHVDALVADLYGLSVDEMAHIATRFPKYDKGAGELAYPELVVDVYRAYCDGGSEAGEVRAQKVTEARKAAGVGFSLDEVYVPEGGWKNANAEAKRILEAG
jgi:hypothetical protein